jgi:hypothetical protein
VLETTAWLDHKTTRKMLSHWLHLLWDLEKKQKISRFHPTEQNIY